MIDGLLPYADYRSSSLPWAPRIPSQWQTKRGKALFSQSNLPVSGSSEIVTCFRDGQVTLRRNRRTRGFMEALYEAGYQGVRRGQLVVHAMDAFAGAIGVSDSDGKCTPEYIVCDPRFSEIVPEYYALVLRHAARQDFIRVSCPAVRERAPRFRYPHLGDMQLPLPTREEQGAIVRFLDHANRRIDRFIRAKRKLIALLNEQKQAIIHHAVTQGLDPNVRMKNAGPWLGHIPAHWTLHRLKSLVREAVAGPYGSSLTKAMYTASGYRVYGQQQVIPDNFAVGDYYISPELFSAFSRYRVYPGDILVSVMGTVGRVAVVPEDAELGIINPRLVRYKPDTRIVLSRYLQLTMHSAPAQRQIQEASKGTTMEGLNMRILGRLMILIPPLAEQRAILDYVTTEAKPCLGAIAHVERGLTLIREYRTRLIADVVTGQLDVRAAAARLPAPDPDELASPDPDLTGEDLDAAAEDVDPDVDDGADA